MPPPRHAWEIGEQTFLDSSGFMSSLSPRGSICSTWPYMSFCRAHPLLANVHGGSSPYLRDIQLLRRPAENCCSADHRGASVKTYSPPCERMRKPITSHHRCSGKSGVVGIASQRSRQHSISRTSHDQRRYSRLINIFRAGSCCRVSWGLLSNAPQPHGEGVQRLGKQEAVRVLAIGAAIMKFFA